MTSISPPVNLSQASNNTSQAVAPSHSPSASASGRPTPQAAGSATAKSSYANATKSTFSPPSGPSSSNSSGATAGQHGKLDTTPQVNGRIPIPPAIPAVASPTIVNGNLPTNSTSGVGDHGRKPSVTISATGAPGYAPNGATGTGKPSAGNGIQFGAMDTTASPALRNSSPQLVPPSNTLSVNSPSNPRITSPQTSPSPIPQPPASGGKPPSAMHNHTNSVSFGNFDGPGGPIRNPSFSQSPLISGAQTSHLRRESSQSQHSDVSNHGMGPAAGRGFPQQGGRGRAYGSSYGQQMSYSPAPPNFRPPPNRSGSVGSFQQPGRQYPQYPNSPHQAPRQPHSPMPPNAQPLPSQPGQMAMQNSHMGQPQYGYPNQAYGYPPNMGPQPVKPSSPMFKGPPSTRKWRQENKHPVPPDPNLDLSPQTGNFEHFLTSMSQGYTIHQNLDPNFVANYAYLYSQQPSPNMVPPQSPRPPAQYPPGPQTPFQGQYGHQPPSMSRTSSAISGTDRPSSSMGKPQPSSTPAPSHTTANQPSNSPAPKVNNFQKPKKSSGIVIKDPSSGEVVNLKKSASPAPSNKSSTSIPAAPTPPPSNPVANDPSHSRTESKSITKTDGKDLREQLARQHREKEEADAKAAQAKKTEEDDMLKQKDAADAKQRDAAKAQIAAEDAEKQKRLDSEQAKKDAEKAEAAAAEAEKKTSESPEFDEDEIARWEAEEAEEAKKEAEREAAYAKKKQAERDEAARKEAEAFKMADEEMKRAEREAEEAEEARIHEREKEGTEAENEKAVENADTPSRVPSTPGVETPVEDTPEGSGVATPNSDAQTMPPPDRKALASAAKPKPSALKLETSKSVEPPQPSAALMSLRSARRLTSLDIQYPAGKASPNPAINVSAKMGKFRYDRDFLLQFKEAFKEKPSENWTEKIRETVGDTGEPQSARGTPRSSAGGSLMGSRQPSNRGPPQTQQMGMFVGNRTLPAGTTSEQRFQAANRAMSSGRPTMQNPLASYVSRPGGFPQPTGSIKMDRTPSSTSIAHPNSPRTASQRGGSQRGSRASRREDPKDNKNMPLTAGGNVEPIKVSTSGWKPRSVGPTSMAGPAPGGDGKLAPDVVQRKVKSNLNKMTPNNFDKISDQILAIAHQSKDESDGRSLRQVIQLTFEKATDEAHWAEMYAQFCKRMLESMSPEIKDENILDKKGEVVVGGALFRKYLLTRCQTEFERGWKMNLPEQPEGSTEATMLSEEYYIAAAAKRRGLGLVRFIGELYKLQMLTERIMHECVKKLVDYEGIPDEAEVESLTSLLKTIGQQLDSSEKGHSMMDAYFARIQNMINIKDLPSRMTFMLMDVVDLRVRHHWQPKGGAVIKGPTTIDGVRQQAVEAERQKEAQRAQDNSRRGGPGRAQQGRGDARGFSSGSQFGAPPPDYHKNTVGMDDLRRLNRNASSRQTSTVAPTFGPTSMFAPNARGSNTRRPLNLASANDSGASSRVSTPPAQKEKKDKEKEESAKSAANTFSVLATADGSGDATSPRTSPALSKATPAISEVAKDKPTEAESSTQS